jgi:hypothetical protein
MHLPALSRRLVLGSLIALLLWLAPGAMFAGTLQEDYQGFYSGVDNDTGQEFLARVEFPSPSGTIVVTLFEADGDYRVYGGGFERGGLYIPYGVLNEAKDAQAGYQILRWPRLVHTPEGGINLDLLVPESRCELQFDFAQPGRMTYGCEDRRNGTHSGGTLIRRRG